MIKKIFVITLFVFFVFISSNCFSQTSLAYNPVLFEPFQYSGLYAGYSNFGLCPRCAASSNVTCCYICNYGYCYLVCPCPYLPRGDLYSLFFPYAFPFVNASYVDIAGQDTLFIPAPWTNLPPYIYYTYPYLFNTYPTYPQYPSYMPTNYLGLGGLYNYGIGYNYAFPLFDQFGFSSYSANPFI